MIQDIWLILIVSVCISIVLLQAILIFKVNSLLKVVKQANKRTNELITELKTELTAKQEANLKLGISINKQAQEILKNINDLKISIDNNYKIIEKNYKAIHQTVLELESKTHKIIIDSLTGFNTVINNRFNKTDSKITELNTHITVATEELKNEIDKKNNELKKWMEEPFDIEIDR